MYQVYKLRKIKLTFILTGLALVASQLMFVGRTSAYSGWSTVYDYGGSVALVCKTSLQSGYGPVWRVTVAALSSPGTTTSNLVRIYRNGLQTGEILVTAQNGQWNLGYIYGSQVFNDSIWAMGGNGGSASFLGTYGGGYSIANIATCG